MGRHICAHINGGALGPWGTKVGTGSAGLHKTLSLLSMPPSSCLVKVCHQSKLLSNEHQILSFFIIFKKMSNGNLHENCLVLLSFNLTFPSLFSNLRSTVFMTMPFFLFQDKCKTEEMQRLNWSLQGLQVDPSTTAWYFWSAWLSDSHHHEGKEKILQRKGASISYLIFSVISTL